MCIIEIYMQQTWIMSFRKQEPKVYKLNIAMNRYPQYSY